MEHFHLLYLVCSKLKIQSDIKSDIYFRIYRAEAEKCQIGVPTIPVKVHIPYENQKCKYNNNVFSVLMVVKWEKLKSCKKRCELKNIQDILDEKLTIEGIITLLFESDIKFNGS